VYFISHGKLLVDAKEGARVDCKGNTIILRHYSSADWSYFGHFPVINPFNDLYILCYSVVLYNAPPKMEFYSNITS
jgi:hypothetical protein